MLRVGVESGQQKERGMVGREVKYTKDESRASNDGEMRTAVVGQDGAPV